MRPTKHPRIVQHPFATLMQGARLDSVEENENNLTLNVQGLQTISSKLFQRHGKIFERVEGRHVPLKLTFFKVTEFKHSDYYTSLAKYPSDDPSRVIGYMYSWIQRGQRSIIYMIGQHGPLDAGMRFDADRVSYGKGKGGASITFERDWSPSPPMPDRLVPEPNYIHRHFGGDPVSIKLNGKPQQRKLFIGGVHIQPSNRPQVDAVLNIGEEPSKWTKDEPTSPFDRWDNKGEGLEGMSPEVIQKEANWVIDRLQKNQRVLVHCAAGMNRSTTICCAVLMLLEGLTANQALQRVYEHHPWAKPDSHHWLMLRWLEKNR